MRNIGVFVSQVNGVPVGAKEKTHRRDAKDAKKKTGRDKMIKLLVGIVIGAAVGFAYYKFIGCASGVCLLTSNPFISTLYGAVMGALIAGINV